MPSREILLHGLLKIGECPIRLIAPQHGSLIHGDLIGFIMGKLKQLDCGIFALAADNTDIRRLSFLNKTLKDITNTVIIYRDFRDIANALTDILKRTLPAASIEFYTTAAGGKPLYLAPETRFRSVAEDPPENLGGVLGAARSEWYAKRRESYIKILLQAKPFELRGNTKEWCLLIPLFSGDGSLARNDSLKKNLPPVPAFPRKGGRGKERAGRPAYLPVFLPFPALARISAASSFISVRSRFISLQPRQKV